MAVNLSDSFGGNPWVRAWCKAPDERAAQQVVTHMHQSRERLWQDLSSTPLARIKDEQLKTLRDFEVASIVVHAADPASAMTTRRIANALAGKGYPDGFLPSEQLRLRREEHLGAAAADPAEPIRIKARGLTLEMSLRP